jgi:PKD repeat protein
VRHVRPDEQRPRSAARARRILAGLLATFACALLAAPASAVVVRLGSGRAVSYQPLRGALAASPFDALFSNLDYNGGPVMESNTNYLVFWRPPTASAYPAEYESGVALYLEDLAHDSGGHENTDSVATQYNDSEGDYARYQSHLGGVIDDTDPYPKSGCTRAAICLTDEQLEEELASYIQAHGLPADLEHEYFLLTPKGVEDCFEASGTECSAGSSKPVYCAYHSAFEVASGVVVYANDPFVDGLPGGPCDDGNHPSGKPSDSVIEGGLSHEHNESITDPEPNSGWTDLGGSGGENGDKCRGGTESEEFGTPLGTTASGAKYNQVVNGHPYWYQQEWSNQGHKCRQRWSPVAVAPTASFTSEKAAKASELKFDASASTAPGGVSRYNWKFTGAATPTETTVPTISHVFPGTGLFEVALTVFASDGSSIGTSRVVAPGDEGPAAAFSVATAAPAAEAPMSFDGSVSSDPDGAIVAYHWNFGDGSSPGSGPAPSHVYAVAGTYPVTLRVTDGSEQRASMTRTVEVDEAPIASFSASAATAGLPVSFDGRASSDPDGSVVAWRWDFGDGSAPASGATAEHTYAVAGTYAATLTVTDSSGHTGTLSQPLTVARAPLLVSPIVGSPGGGPVPDSRFSASATISSRTGAITLVVTLADAGRLSWLSTFANGRFGVFSASASNCGRGRIRLAGRCRPARITFAKGSESVVAPGTAMLRLRPRAAARRALATALRRRRGLPVAVRVTFESSRGGSRVTHTYTVVVRMTGRTR